MINALCEKLNISMAQKLFREMCGEGNGPDNYTSLVMIDGFCKVGYSFLLEMIGKSSFPHLQHLEGC